MWFVKLIKTTIDVSKNFELLFILSIATKEYFNLSGDLLTFVTVAKVVKKTHVLYEF